MKNFVKCMIPLFMNFYCTEALAFFYADIGVGSVFSNTTDSTSHSPKKLSYDQNSNVFSMPDITWHDHFKNGFDLNMALGYQFNTWSTEVEFVYHDIGRKINGSYDWQVDNFIADTHFRENKSINISNNRAQLYSILTNITYDFYSASKWTTFIGGGIGVSWLHSDKGKVFDTANIISPSLLGNAFSLQLKAGIRYNLYKNISLIAQYRLLGTSQFKAGTGFILLNHRANESLFSTNSYQIKGLITNALELKIRYDFC